MAVRPRPARTRLVLVSGLLLTVLYVAVVVLLVLVVQNTPQVAPLLALLLPLVVLQLLLVLGQAAVMRGPVLVVDDAGIRTRDLVGWVQVPWATLQRLGSSRDGRVLELDAAGGVYLNEKLLRRARHRVRLVGLEVRPEHLLTYLQHRWTLAQQEATRRPGS